MSVVVERSSSLRSGSTGTQQSETTGLSPVEPVAIEEEHDENNASAIAAEEQDELPIELASLTDRFVDSLTAKVHSSPPSIDRLSTRFQDFYVKASTHISTHISASAISSRQHRDVSPSEASTLSSKSSSILSRASRTASSSSKDASRPPMSRVGSEQQMLTSEEINSRRKARKKLEEKRVALEEAVERRACEKIYDRIWRHRSTEDGERDEKLRSRTAALAVVGIGLKELGIEFDDDGKTPEERDSNVRELLSGARESLKKMNDEKYPLGKLRHLEAAHKSLVDTLSQFRSSSSSADEILPTLIFTLISGPPEGVNAVSNFFFIQRFRSADKIDGEAAYCLTNLEAAVTFLETVDLSSLREDEQPSGPPKSASRPVTPRHEKDDAFATTDTSRTRPTPPVLDPINVNSVSQKQEGSSAEKLKEVQSSPTRTTSHHRRISSLLQPPSHALGAASDAVITTADQGIKTISNSLENSYKFLFGRLKERQVSGVGADANGDVIVPKTLDEARRLVSTPPPADDDAGSVASSTRPESITDKISLSGVTASPVAVSQDALTGEDKPTYASSSSSIRRSTTSTRDRSVDSTQSASSVRHVAFTDDTSSHSPVTSSEKSHRQTDSTSTATVPAPGNAVTTNAAVESMRNLGNTLNPLNRLAGLNVMRPFGRRDPAQSGPRTPSPNKAATLGERGSATSAVEKVNGSELGDVAELTTAFPELANALPNNKHGGDDKSVTASLSKISPPIARFMGLQNPGELRISEVLQLLRDYRRLAEALKERDAFS